jgi:uncharacterized protein YlbG (UPF0298 family)
MIMPVMVGDAALVSGFIALAYGLIKLATLLVNKLRTKDDEKPAFTARDREMLTSLYEDHTEVKNLVTKISDIHDVKDEDGIPLVYVPRSYTIQHEKIIDALTQITKSQERTAYILEQIANNLSKLFYVRDSTAK